MAKMKREAKGDEKVASEKRIYLFVEAEARTTTAKIPRGTFWYSKVCPCTRSAPRGGRILMAEGGADRNGPWAECSIWRPRAYR